MSSEDQKGIISPAAIRAEIGAEIGAKFFKPSDKPAKREDTRQRLSADKQQTKEQLAALLGAKKNSPKPQDSPVVATPSDPVISDIETASIPTPPPLPETLTAEEKKARRAAQEEKRRAEQAEQEKREAEKKSAETPATPQRKNSMGPVISNELRAAMAALNAKVTGNHEDEEEWDEEEDAAVSVSPIVATAAVNAPIPPQEPTRAPEVSVTSAPTVTNPAVKTDDRAALLQTIREGVQLKKRVLPQEQDKVVAAATVVPSDEKVEPAAVSEVVKAEPQLSENLSADLVQDDKAELEAVEVTPTKEEAVTSTEVDPLTPSTSEVVNAEQPLSENILADSLQDDKAELEAVEVTPTKEEAVTSTKADPSAPSTAELATAKPQLPGDLLADLAKDNKASLTPVDVKPTKAEVVPSSLPEAAAPAVPTVKASDVLDEMQQNARFKKAKEDANNQPVQSTAPVVEASSDPSKNEWNKGFNRIRQRNIPFQYVPEADLKKGIEAFNQKKAAKEAAKEVGPSAVKTVESAPKPEPTIDPKPASTVDADRDYALALHLDELQRSPNASDRQLAENPEYIRQLQHAYDNNNTRDTKAFNQMDLHAQKEERRQNLEKTYQPRPQSQKKSSRDFYSPQSSMLRAPRMQPQSHQAAQPAMAQSARELYMMQSITFLMVTHMQISSFETSASVASHPSACSASFFMSYTHICLSQTQSLSVGKDGSVSYSTSQSLSYTQMNIAGVDDGKGNLSYSAAAVAYQHHSRACSFFPGQAKEAAPSVGAPHHSLRSLMDKVEPIGSPATTMKVR